MTEKLKLSEKITNPEVGKYLTLKKSVSTLKNAISILGNSGLDAFKSIFGK